MKTKKENKIVKEARIAKEYGYEYICSIVKRYKYTNYWHVVRIDDVLREGKWHRAPYRHGNGWHGPRDTKQVPTKTVTRQYVYYLASKS